MYKRQPWERVIDTATGWVVPDAEPREVVDPVSGTVNVLGLSLIHISEPTRPY